MKARWQGRPNGSACKISSNRLTSSIKFSNWKTKKKRETSIERLLIWSKKWAHLNGKVPLYIVSRAQVFPEMVRNCFSAILQNVDINVSSCKSSSPLCSGYILYFYFIFFFLTRTSTIWASVGNSGHWFPYNVGDSVLFLMTLNSIIMSRIVLYIITVAWINSDLSVFCNHWGKGFGRIQISWLPVSFQ